jgi:hypothetical protein
MTVILLITDVLILLACTVIAAVPWPIKREIQARTEQRESHWTGEID